MMKPHPATGRLLFPLVALAVILADQLSKAMALAAWSGTAGPQARFGPFCALLVRNTGVAFGLGQSRPALIVVITLAGAVATLGAAGAGLRVRGRGAALGLGLIAGGALGNGADRMIRSPGPLRGAVIDWITLDARGPVFNLADVALISGTLLTAALLLRRPSREREREPERVRGRERVRTARPGPSGPGAGLDPLAVSLPPCAPRPDRRPDPPPEPSPSPGSAPAAPPPPPAPGSPAPRGTPRSP
ncbi:signal peptidase II [Streptomyces rhizosphaericus]|uniref:Lipoprotein signal peptidase n=1 Tax=Streptomyces rhizosphaericus TaxID=114699 RepID=A0A6G4AUG2_9ACTN|nr:signal peptidase II [Streptomyces rhizosphaericus]NEW76299.1 signal peptidase II [Streptomyces rhizosphaericus]